MRRKDKTVAMLKANMLVEQRYLKVIDVLEEGLWDDTTDAINKVGGKVNDKLAQAKEFMSQNLPKVKEASEIGFNKAKEKIAQANDFAVEQWDDPENQAKLKSMYGKIKEAINKIMSGAAGLITDPDKIKSLMNTFKGGAILSLSKGVWDLVFTTGWDAGIGGIWWFKLAAFLYVMKLCLSVIDGFGGFTKAIKGIAGWFMSIIKIFTGGGGVNESTNNLTLNESVVLLFEKYGYPEL